MRVGLILTCVFLLSSLLVLVISAGISAYLLTRFSTGDRSIWKDFRARDISQGLRHWEKAKIPKWPTETSVTWKISVLKCPWLPVEKFLERLSHFSLLSMLWRFCFRYLSVWKGNTFTMEHRTEQTVPESVRIHAMHKAAVIPGSTLLNRQRGKNLKSMTYGLVLWKLEEAEDRMEECLS